MTINERKKRILARIAEIKAIERKTKDGQAQTDQDSEENS